MKTKVPFLAVVICICPLLRGSVAAEKPNVLFIAIDDMNDWVGCLGGHPDTLTPHLDRLAARGTLFTNAHCQAPICNPSRTSVMYGLRPSTSGIYTNGPLPWKVPALDRYSTLPRWFARHGYHTACAGKLYHSSQLPDGDFDAVGPRPGQRLPDRDERLRTDLPKGAAALWDFGPQSYDDHLFQDHAVATWAIEQLGRDPGKPFFLAVGFYRPHVPFYAPQRIFDDLPVNEVDLPNVKADDWDDIPRIAREVTFNKAPPPHSWFVDNGAWPDAVQAYLACIRWTDEQIGRLLDALDASALAENTIVALYSDHGFHLGEKDRWTKFSLWERSTRVPLILCAPGLPAGQRCDHPAELLSLYPTLLELCGLSANPHLEGRSLVPLLRDASADWPHHALTTHGRDNHAVRSHRWRYLRYHDGSEELYDMQADPDEWDNLAADGFSEEEAAVVARLSASLPANNQAPRGRAATRRAHIDSPALPADNTTDPRTEPFSSPSHGRAPCGECKVTNQSGQTHHETIRTDSTDDPLLGQWRSRLLVATGGYRLEAAAQARPQHDRGEHPSAPGQRLRVPRRVELESSRPGRPARADRPQLEGRSRGDGRNPQGGQHRCLEYSPPPET